jgi:hypothetical protein
MLTKSIFTLVAMTYNIFFSEKEKVTGAKATVNGGCVKTNIRFSRTILYD